MKAFDVVLCCLVSGALLSLTHGFLPALAVVAMVPFFVGLRQASGREAFYGGLGCGLLESVILVGILNYHWTLYVGLCLLYGLERAVFGWVYRALSQQGGLVWRVALAPAIWVLLEYLHVLLPGSLPNLLGDTQHHGVFLPLARVGGTHLVAAVLIGFNVCLAETWAHWREKKSPAVLSRVWVGFGLLLAIFYGLAWQNAPGPAEGSKRVAVIQGGFPRWVNRMALEVDQWSEVPLNIYARLTLGAKEADLTVWPEAAVWNYWGADKSYEGVLRDISQRRGAFLAGILRKDSGGTPFNSALFLEEGKSQIADKQRLVMQEELMFGLGEKAAVYESSMGTLGVVFCLESVIPTYTRVLAQAQAQAVIVLASGSDLGHTPVARIHAQRSIVRAVEIGRPVIHAGNHGFSMLIDPWGNVQEVGAIFESAVVEGDIFLRSHQTWFTRFGSLPLVVLSALVVMGGVIFRFQRFRASRSSSVS